MSEAKVSTKALIAFFENENPHPSRKCDIRIGEWIKKFTSITESPKAARLIAKNRPYSIGSLDRLKGLYEFHMKDDPFMNMLMSEAESQDALAFINRMAMRKLTGGLYNKKKEQPLMMGTETFAKLIKFARMAFREYGRDRPYWHNPFRDIEPPGDIENAERDFLSEEEVLKLFSPSVLRGPMEVAVCAAMFFAGLRRSEVFALRAEDLDWRTPKITVRRAWQNFHSKNRRLDTPKSKKSRVTAFDKRLQEAILNLWKENGQHEWTALGCSNLCFFISSSASAHFLSRL
jgi:integrase